MRSILLLVEFASFFWCSFSFAHKIIPRLLLFLSLLLCTLFVFVVSRSFVLFLLPFCDFTKIPKVVILRRPMIDYNRDRRSCVLNCYQLRSWDNIYFYLYFYLAYHSYSLNPPGCGGLSVHTCQSNKISQFGCPYA